MDRQGWNYQGLTFGLTDLALVVLAQLPALLGLTEAQLWQSFARWFAAL